MSNKYTIEDAIAFMELQNGYLAILDTPRVNEAKSVHWWCEERRKKGRGTGVFQVRGYIDKETRKKVLLHNFLFPELTLDGKQIDHINRNPLDCRMVNVRTTTCQQNSQNCPPKKSLSGSRGVTWEKDKNLWRARVRSGTKTLASKRFPGTEEGKVLAAQWAREQRAILFPFSTD